MTETTTASLPSGNDPELRRGDEPAAVQHFYAVSIQHTHRSEPYICFWRPHFAGYAWPLSWAGKYTEKDDAEHPMYLHRGDDTIMVRAEVVESLAVAPKPGRIDRNAGPVVPNTARSWKKLLSAMLRPPTHTPRPQYPGAPKL